jgi:hypothetical protein
MSDVDVLRCKLAGERFRAGAAAGGFANRRGVKEVSVGEIEQKRPDGRFRSARVDRGGDEGRSDCESRERDAELLSAWRAAAFRPTQV